MTGQVYLDDRAARDTPYCADGCGCVAEVERWTGAIGPNVAVDMVCYGCATVPDLRAAALAALVRETSSRHGILYAYETDQAVRRWDDAVWRLAVESARWVRLDPRAGFGDDHRTEERMWRYRQLRMRLRWMAPDLAGEPGKELMIYEGMSTCE